MRLATRVILLDEASLRAVRHESEEISAELVPNFIDLSLLPERRQALTNESRCALFVGWVLPTKGVAELLAAWAKVDPADWCLDIIGPFDPQYRDSLIAEFELPTVRFLGALAHEEVLDRMAHCDLFLLPSHTEGFPIVVLEAMSLARPIIASDVGAVPEMLANDAGIVVESRDVDLLAQAIVDAVADTKLRDRLGSNARARASSLYSIETVFSRLLSIWNTVSSSSFPPQSKV